MSDESRQAYRAVIDRLVDAGAEGIVLGCTEIELLIEQTDSPVPVFPTTRLHVESALDAAFAVPAVDPVTPELDAIPGLLGIDHVALAVADIEAAIVFHTTVLGLRLEHREDNQEQGVREAMLVAGDANGVLTRLQLIAPLADPGPGPASSVARFLTRRGPGLHHLAYRVS